MKRSATLLVFLLSAMSACSPGVTENMEMTAADEADAQLANQVRTQMADADRFYRLAACSQTMLAMANTYDMLAQEQPEREQELMRLSAESVEASERFERLAIELAPRAQRRPEDVNEIIEQTQQNIRDEAERTRGDPQAFQTFLRVRAMQADDCQRTLDG